MLIYQLDNAKLVIPTDESSTFINYHLAIDWLSSRGFQVGQWSAVRPEQWGGEGEALTVRQWDSTQSWWLYMLIEIGDRVFWLQRLLIRRLMNWRTLHTDESPSYWRARRATRQNFTKLLWSVSKWAKWSFSSLKLLISIGSRRCRKCIF